MGSLDRKAVEERLVRLGHLLRRLERDARCSLEEYLADDDLQARVERRLQLAAHVCLDVANYAVARAKLEIPEEEENVFVVMTSGILEPALGERMKGLSRFRNILVHDYLTVDPAIVHRLLVTRLGDFRRFAAAVVRFLEAEERR